MSFFREYTCMLNSSLPPRPIPVPPQTAPPPRMVNLCQATQTTIIAPNPMLQGALLMQQMQGRVLMSSRNTTCPLCFNTDHGLLSPRQHAGLRNGWAAVPAVLRSVQQVVPAGSCSHGHGHKIPHHGFPSCSTVPPTRALLQQQHRRCCHHGFFLLLLHLHHSNYHSH